MAFVFTPANFPINQVQQLFTNYGITVFGATGANQIYDLNILEGAVSVMLTDMPDDAFDILIEEQIDPYDYFSVGHSIGAKAKELFSSPQLVIGLTGNGLIDGDGFIDGLIAQLGYNAKIFGGIASDDLNFSYAKIFNNRQILEQGGIALVMDGDRILIDGISTSGWEPLGEKKLINKSDRNIVYEIDGEPAITAYIKYYGLPDNVKKTKAILEEYGAKFPLIVYNNGKPPVMRIPVYADPEKLSLAFAGIMPQNSEVRFTVPPTFEIIENTIERFKKVKNRFPEADFVLMFSCKARHIVFSIMLEDEIMFAKRLWDKPLAGYFTYGEFGAGEDGHPAYHNETATLILFKEKQISNI